MPPIITKRAYRALKRRAAQQGGVVKRVNAPPGSVYRNPYAGKLNRKGLASKESGFVDLAGANYACDTTGSITLLATVPAGTSVNTRVGKKIRWMSILSRGQIFNNTTATISNAAVIMVYDRRPTGSLPAITDVLTAVGPDAMNNDANSGRFKILRRWDYCLIGNSTTPATGQEAKDFSEFVDLKMAPCVFKAAGTGQIGDIEQGALYLITVGDKGAGTTASNLAAAFRVRFVDV